MTIGTELADELEAALRIRMWNDCRRQGMKDDAAYKCINDEIDAIKARTRTASSREGL